MDIILKMNRPKKNYDVVIIGGGIHGAGCAQSLSARGYSSLLIEKNTIGFGTSSKSSKLIHGGLRYLESGQLNLVRKSLKERAILQRIAPELVHKRKFLIPIYKKNRLKNWQITIALYLYNLLGNFRDDTAFSRIPKENWSDYDIKKKGLVSILQYWDAQTDDLELTKSVINSAKEMSCDVLEQTEFIKASIEKDKNVLVKLSIDNHELEVKTKLVINAAGPWVEKIQSLIDFTPKGPMVDLVQGTHIEFDQLISKNIFYLESPSDHRPIFIMPWKDGTLIGTTEVLYKGNPEENQPTQDEIHYLKETLYHYFPNYSGKFINAWSGLRVLPKPNNSNINKRQFSKQARDTELIVDRTEEPRAISIFGGKLTAYRITAKNVAILAEKALGKPKKYTNTSEIHLKSPL